MLYRSFQDLFVVNSICIRRHMHSSTYTHTHIQTIKHNFFVLFNGMKHFTYGSGYPLALHVNVTLVPSRTTISLLVAVSMITGGTINVWMKFLDKMVIIICIYQVDQSYSIYSLTYNLKISFTGSHWIYFGNGNEIKC